MEVLIRFGGISREYSEMLHQPPTLENPGYRKHNSKCQYAPLSLNYAQYGSTQYTFYITVIKHANVVIFWIRCLQLYLIIHSSHDGLVVVVQHEFSTAF